MKETLTPHHTIRRILGGVHCAKSQLSAVREVIEQCWGRASENPRACFLAMPRQHRRFFVASCFQVHASNRATYFAVTSLRETATLEGHYFFDTETKTVGINRKP